MCRFRVMAPPVRPISAQEVRKYHPVYHSPRSGSTVIPSKYGVSFGRGDDQEEHELEGGKASGLGKGVWGRRGI